MEVRTNLILLMPDTSKLACGDLLGFPIDLPKLEYSEVTMEARLTNDLEIEVRTN